MSTAWLVSNRWLVWQRFELQFEALLQRADEVSLTRCTNDHAAVAVARGDALPDVALVMDKDVALIASLEARGVRCINSARAIAMCDNKALTHAALTAAGIAHPDTVVLPYVFDTLSREQWRASEAVAAAKQILGYPLVAKRAVGSWGRGVHLVADEEELVEMICATQPAPIILERFIARSRGTDARVYMVGDEPVAAMRRFAAGSDFRANLTGGGKAQPWDPPAQYVEVARRAMAALGLEIGAVDFLDSDEPLVGEVNSNAQFMSLSEVTGVDVASRVISYLNEVARR
ncbi:ATP-grasp domain-containing protein [Corynebacterium mayonis]|uniref:ATP-grasp domain-containing protein n=1 Tax=Corynebacterium mayonis TaxID=3062461 RepID=UPI0031403359